MHITCQAPRRLGTSVLFQGLSDWRIPIPLSDYVRLNWSESRENLLMTGMANQKQRAKFVKKFTPTGTCGVPESLHAVEERFWNILELPGRHTIILEGLRNARESPDTPGHAAAAAMLTAGEHIIKKVIAVDCRRGT